VEHLLKVAASLDSLVLGETQILAQIKDAYAIAASEGATGKALNGLLHRAFSVAKEIHSQTAISRGRLSIATVAVDLIRRTFDDLDRRAVLLVGLGEMGELTLRHLREAGVGTVIVANRTHQRALDMAKTIDGEAIPLTLLADYLHRADIVVSQTAAPGIVISRDMVARAMKQRSGRSMFLVDLAVPRDIHPEADLVEGVYRYEIDDLQRVVAEASEARTAEVARALELVAAAKSEFVAGMRTVSVEPLLNAIRARHEAMLAAECQRVAAGLPPESAEAAREASRRFMNKLLHQATMVIKDAAREGGDRAMLAAAAQLFGVSGAVGESAAPRQEIRFEIGGPEADHGNGTKDSPASAVASPREPGA
jgi:glutamyl-tRNA reductase